MCGLPGYGPGDLIDMAFDGDRVTLTYDAGIDRPLRLTPDEALALVVALRMLAETPGRGRPGGDRPGTGQDRERGRRVPRHRWRCGCPATRTGCPALREAVARRTGAADHLLRGDPRPRPPNGSWTRCGWWWSAGTATWRRGAAGRGVRRFRADRIDALTVLDEPADAAAAGPARGRRATGSSSRARTCRWSRCEWAGEHAGSPSTTRASGWRSQPEAVAGVAARHGPGLGTPSRPGARPGRHGGSTGGVGCLGPRPRRCCPRGVRHARVGVTAAVAVPGAGLRLR